MATRRTRSQVTVETLDDAIAELIYGEYLPDKSSSSTSCGPTVHTALRGTKASSARRALQWRVMDPDEMTRTSTLEG